MKTENLKHQKSHYDIRYLLMWVTIIISPIFIQAQYVSQPTDNHDIIKDISYDYELTESPSQGLQCYGTLYLSIDISDDIERLILERTSPHHPEDSSPKFLLKQELPLDDLIAIQDYPWKIKFRIGIYYKDGTKKNQISIT